MRPRVLLTRESSCRTTTVPNFSPFPCSPKRAQTRHSIDLTWHGAFTRASLFFLVQGPHLQSGAEAARMGWLEEVVTLVVFPSVDVGLGQPRDVHSVHASLSCHDRRSVPLQSALEESVSSRLAQVHSSRQRSSHDWTRRIQFQILPLRPRAALALSYDHQAFRKIWLRRQWGRPTCLRQQVRGRLASGPSLDRLESSPSDVVWRGVLTLADCVNRRAFVDGPFSTAAWRHTIELMSTIPTEISGCASSQSTKSRHGQTVLSVLTFVTLSSTVSVSGRISILSSAHSEFSVADSATRRVTTNRNSRLKRQMISTHPRSGTRQIKTADTAICKEEPTLGTRNALLETKQTEGMEILTVTCRSCASTPNILTEYDDKDESSIEHFKSCIWCNDDKHGCFFLTLANWESNLIHRVSFVIRI